MTLVRAPLGCAVREALRGAVAVVGNLDGVHRGHQVLLEAAADEARRQDAPLAAVTFQPHPRRAFTPDTPPFLLTTLPQKTDLLRAAGCQTVFALPFGDALYQLSPDAFVRDVLAGVLGLRGAVVGEDFRFGAKRAGDAATLTGLAARAGLTARIVAVAGGAQKWSSTTARHALREGRPADAATVLGRPFAIRGTVIEGRHLARTMQFPTANVDLGDYVRPAYGVYAVTARLPDGTEAGGVANIGVRPTVDGETERLEAHLFDWSGDLYGQEIEVALHAFLRSEMPFDGVEALRSQIAKDAAAAREALTKIEPMDGR